MKITRRQLRKIILESIYGRGKYKPGPVDPMAKISTGGGSSVNRIPAVHRDKLETLASDPNTAADADLLAPQVQTPDLVIPFEGEPYEEKVFKGDSYEDELIKFHEGNPSAVIFPIKKMINKHIPNLEKVLHREIGSKISSSSRLFYDWSIPHDGVVVEVDSNIITLDDMSLLAAEALFGRNSQKYQKLKSFMPYDLHYLIASNQISFTGLTSDENKLIFDSTMYSFSAYLAFKAIKTGAKANFGSEYIGSTYCNIGYRQSPSEPQEIEFSSFNSLGPAIFRAAKVFDNITIEGEKILPNARMTLEWK